MGVLSYSVTIGIVISILGRYSKDTNARNITNGYVMYRDLSRCHDKDYCNSFNVCTKNNTINISSDCLGNTYKNCGNYNYQIQIMDLYLMTHVEI